MAVWHKDSNRYSDTKYEDIVELKWYYIMDNLLNVPFI
jgi:hypothetical protein